jgi:uncharacterized protein YprB with RNaseH-like and TPR domain
MMEKLIVIKTLKELRALTELLKSYEFIAFDTETTGLEKDSEIIGVRYSRRLLYSSIILGCYATETNLSRNLSRY